MSTVKQDMPPPGGFSRIIYERVPLKNYWPAPSKWLIMFGMMAIGWTKYKMDRKRKYEEALEQSAAWLSIVPMLSAENDRQLLKHCRKIRDEEAELMKDVEGWKVGTYFGEPIYKSLKPNEWYEPFTDEVWAHSYKKDQDFPKYLRATH